VLYGRWLSVGIADYLPVIDGSSKEIDQSGIPSNIGCAAYYPVPLHRQAVHRNLGYRGGSFPVAEHVSRHCLSLPMFAELTTGQQEAVAKAVTQVAKSMPETITFSISREEQRPAYSSAAS
jgi:hypothetical protein